MYGPPKVVTRAGTLVDKDDSDIQVLRNLLQVIHVLVELLLALGQLTTSGVVSSKQGSDGVHDLRGE